MRSRYCTDGCDETVIDDCIGRPHMWSSDFGSS